jgi:GTP1/Obg family GTP-binding protein
MKLILFACFLTLLVTFTRAIESTNRVYTIVALGTIGVGKTSLLNMFANNSNAVFEPLSFTESIYYEYQSIKLRLIDTKSLSDETREKDSQNIQQTIELIQRLKSVDLFLLCFDGTNTPGRLAEYTRVAIDIYKQVLPNFMQHMVVVFNKWTTPDKKHLIKVKNEYQTIFGREFECPNVECFFIGKKIYFYFPQNPVFMTPDKS